MYDCILLGQGLAGSVLAWWLRRRDARVLVIDREAEVTSSRIAAGLITPVTGKRLVKTGGWDEFWPAAVEFYRQVETETGRRFFDDIPMVRLFSSPAERDVLECRMAADLAGLLRSPSPPVESSRFHDSHGGFEMPTAGRLDVAGFLDATRERLRSRAEYVSCALDVRQDLNIEGDQVALPRLGVRGRRLIFCQGFDGGTNPWFAPVRFNPAKGEILTIRVPGLRESRVIHRGIWLAPIGGDLYRVGATYEWKQLDTLPTAAAREELCRRLNEVLKLPFEVVDHHAAVRPTMQDFKPVLGLHPQYPQLGIFNGLGSKGSLLAPLLGRWLADLLTDGVSLSPEIDVQRWFH